MGVLLIIGMMTHFNGRIFCDRLRNNRYLKLINTIDTYIVLISLVKIRSHEHFTVDESTIHENEKYPFIIQLT